MLIRPSFSTRMMALASAITESRPTMTAGRRSHRSERSLATPSWVSWPSRLAAIRVIRCLGPGTFNETCGTPRPNPPGHGQQHRGFLTLGARHIRRGPASGLVMMGVWLERLQPDGEYSCPSRRSRSWRPGGIGCSRSSATVGDFRRGSVSEIWRKCGKPNCACAAPDHPGHGPRFLWTRSQGRRKRVRPAAGCRRGGEGPPRDRAARGVLGGGGQIIEVNEAICEARPAAGSAADGDPSGTGGEKGGSGRRSRRRRPPR